MLATATSILLAATLGQAAEDNRHYLAVAEQLSATLSNGPTLPWEIESGAVHVALAGNWCGGVVIPTLAERGLEHSTNITTVKLRLVSPAITYRPIDDIRAIYRPIKKYQPIAIVE